MYKKTLFFILCLFAIGANAQISFKGTVVDALSGESLVGATVRISETKEAMATNSSGVFNFSVKENKPYTLIVSFVGFQNAKLVTSPTTFAPIVVKMYHSVRISDDVLISATRANAKTPTTYTNVNAEQLAKNNNGQDLTYMLDQTPSVVVNSDAGAGVGYTGIRIRGSDITRINVTINGIPVNDAESHGVWWVNMPDLASSVDNIQIQRGVGTSTNGGAAFGASMNIQTNKLIDTAYAQLSGTLGSFNTSRAIVKFGTGLLNNGWSFDGRMSKINSNGYIDRSSSDMKSFFFSGSWSGKKDLFRFNVTSGKEKTYQAWNGVEEEKLAASRTYNSAGSYFDKNGVEQFYKNETDNYQQDHYQTFYTHEFNRNWNVNAAAFLTYGRGYYEQYKSNQKLSKYGISPFVVDSITTITRTDLIRRKWLDNYFYGAIYSANYTNNNGLNAVLGGGLNKYDGKHFGEVIWARNASNSEINQQYYSDNASKTDGNIYAKVNKAVSNFDLFADLQYRFVNYTFLGFNAALQHVDQTVNYSFLNPKIGAGYKLNNHESVYASIAMSNREPLRNDFVSSTPTSRPKHEQMLNVETGYRLNKSKFSFEATGYLMNYKNQMVLTGNINDVGAYTRMNVDKSYRAGIELQGSTKITSYLFWRGNLTLSQNIITQTDLFVDSLDANYDYAGNVFYESLKNTQIALSPNIIGSSVFTLTAKRGFSFDVINKYVGKQYLDNTTSVDRMLKEYFLTDLRLNFASGNIWNFKNVKASIQMNNVFGKLYSAMGYTYTYKQGNDLGWGNYHYPQAQQNWLLNLSLQF